MASLQPFRTCQPVTGYIDPAFNQDTMVGITPAERLHMQQWLEYQGGRFSKSAIEAPSALSQSPFRREIKHGSGAEFMESPPAPPQSSRLPLVETLMGCIDTYQYGQANDSTYLRAANAIRDLHAFVHASEQEETQRVRRSSGVTIIIDGEEFTVQDYGNKRIAVRSRDSAAFNSSTGDYIGIWNARHASVTREAEFEVE